MKKTWIIISTVFLTSVALGIGASTRTLNFDSWSNVAKTKTWTPPSVTGTLSCIACTETLTNKTMSGASNTFSNIPNSATTAVSTNTASTIVTRDGSGNFAAGTITAALTGNVTGNLTGNVTGNVTGAVTGNASTATALAADPADCSSNQFATTIAANGALTCAQPNFTDLAGSATNAQIGSGYTQPYELTNVGYKISVSAGAMTISLTQTDGSTACGSGASACKVSFHGTTQNVGANSQISITAATTITLAATDSLGTNAATTDGNLYIYLVNDTTPEICASGSYWDDGVNPSSPSALTGGADTTITTLWCTSAHTNKSIKYIGYINATWSNPNWTTAGATLAPGRFPVMAAGALFGSTGLSNIGRFIYPSAANQVPVASGAGPTNAWSWAQLALSALSGTISSSQVVTATFTAPTIQVFTSGSSTYTVPTSPRTPLYLIVTLVGAGGGGAGSGTTNGTVNAAATDTTFSAHSGAAILTAAKGAAAARGSTASGGVGGAPTIAAGATKIIAMNGNDGAGCGSDNLGTDVSWAGGAGGAGPWGGAGLPAINAGGNSVANSGAGGPGGGLSAVASGICGGGGGAGAFIRALVTSPSASYDVVIGTAGVGQSAGTSGAAGGNGGSGYLVVEEFYQ